MSASPATDAFAVRALDADAVEALAAEAALAPAVLAGQDRCPRHRAPCARCRADSPRAERLAARGLRVCVCEGAPCSCGLAMLLAADGAAAVHAVRLALAFRDGIAAACAPA